MHSKVARTDQRGSFPESDFRYTPLQHVRTLYVRFVQGLFQAAPHGAYHWDPSPNLSEVTISDESPIHADRVGQRPAISFTRGPVQFFTLGMDDMLGYDFRTGAKKKSVLVPGIMNINCCSRVDIESEQLGWIIAEQLWMNRELLMREGFFEIGRQPVVGAPSPAGSLVVNDSGDEWFATTVACPFQFYRTSSVTPLNAQIVRNIQLSLRAQIQSPRGDVGYPYDPSGLPYQVDVNAPPHFSQASDVTGYNPRPGEEAPEPPTVPHPLNPAQRVTVRTLYPFAQGVRPPSIAGRAIPISSDGVEESPQVTATSTVKV